MKNKYVFVVVMLLAILIISFGFTNIYVSQIQDTDEDDFVVVTSFYPMYIAAMNVIGDTEGVTLKNLSEPQTGCLHDFQLTPADMKLLSTADVFIINGGEIEAFMEEIAAQYPELTVIEACEEIELLCEEAHDENHDHDHDHDHDHNHDINAHAWMSVELYRKQIETIAEGLAKADAEHSASYIANQKVYDGKLVELQAKQDSLISQIQGEAVILLHSAFEYVAEDYGLEAPFCMDLDEERQISAGEVAEVLEIIGHDQVQYIFAEELYAASMCDMLQKEADVKVIYLDPLTRGEYDADSYLVGMRANMELLQEAFSN